MRIRECLLICKQLSGALHHHLRDLERQAGRLALEDNPAHYYEGILWVNRFKSQKGNSTITLEYDVHPTMYILNVGAVVMDIDSIQLTKGMEYRILVGVGPTKPSQPTRNMTG